MLPAHHPLPRPHPPVWETQDLDQRSSEKTDTPNGKPGCPGSRPLLAHPQSCCHMASARVKRKWEPAGAPCPPRHPESEPSALEQHSVTKRNATSGCAGVRGIPDYVLSSLQASLGGATRFCYIHAKNYNNIVIVLLKLKKRNTFHSGHFSFFDYCSNESVLLQLLESLREGVHTDHNKLPYLRNIKLPYRRPDP